MFIDIEYTGYFPSRLNYEYTLRDSDFTVRINTNKSWPKSVVEILLIVKEYEDRNLNVSGNLALWYKTIAEFEQLSFEDLLDKIKKWDRESYYRIKEKYLRNVNKYLLLI